MSRPWPRPARPWRMAQTWHDLLFAHWPVPPGALRPLLPAALGLDTFEGRAWIGVVPFRMSGVRLRGWPALPFVSALPELNVRTYVTAEGRSGVWFVSLDGDSPLAVAVARRFYHLPYYRARMSCEADGDGIRYASRRSHRAAPPAELRARYAPTGPPALAAPGTLAHWLTERYCLYAGDGAGGLWRGEIDHEPWSLQPAAAQIEANTMAAAAGVPLPEAEPLLHFARRLDALLWGLDAVATEAPRGR